MQKKLLTILGIIMLVAALFFGFLKFRDTFHNEPETQNNTNTQDQSNNNQGNEQEPEDQPDQDEQPAAFDKTTLSTSEAGSLWWVVNKTRPLNPKTYIPPNLVFPDVTLRVPGNESMKIRSDVAKAIEKMFGAAKSAGFSPMFSSGYRSYSYQVNLYGSYVNSQGQAEADKQSARPGFSEHQTGLAFDICNAGDCELEQAFGDTGLGKWVAANAYKYGFTIRYKKDMQGTTGYIYEPWHLRYVGVELAAELQKTGETLEEFFGLPKAPDYL